MRRTYRRHKLKITDATLRAFKVARVRELISRGRPIPSCLLLSITTTPAQHVQQQRLPFATEASID